MVGNWLSHAPDRGSAGRVSKRRWISYLEHTALLFGVSPSSFPFLGLLFLTLDEVLELHRATLKAHGGKGGVRSMDNLHSALAMPQSGMGEDYFHTTIWEMAAAYAFHICQNQPFFDGNKRVGLMAALTFLHLNGIEIRDPSAKLYDAMMDIASGRGSKASLAVTLQGLAEETRGKQPDK